MRGAEPELQRSETRVNFLVRQKFISFIKYILYILFIYRYTKAFFTMLDQVLRKNIKKKRRRRKRDGEIGKH